MFDPPGYLWAITIAGIAAIPALTCVVLGGWFTASAVIAGNGWYHTRLGHWVPLPIAVVGFLGTLLALSRIPVVRRAMAAPGMVSRLMHPHSFRVAGVVAALWFNAFGITDLVARHPVVDENST